jgi:hypothetical protein
MRPNCQELYFLEDTATPILQTDASDYGIGGYKYMIVDHQVRVFGRIAIEIVCSRERMLQHSLWR